MVMGDAFWPVVFLAMGLALVSLELFVPSGGFIGLSAAVCLGLGLWNAFQSSTSLGMTFVLIDFVAVPVTLVVAFRIWARSPLGRAFVLGPPADDEVSVSHSADRIEELVGLEGRALTPLRPSGHVEVRGRRYDGMAESGLIPGGSAVRVVRARSGQVVVRLAGPSATPTAADGPPADLDVENPQLI